MENNEIKMLITTFKEYRDLLTPIEENLKSFSMSFDSIRNDIENLNTSFDGSVQQKLDSIYKELSNQADKARTLSSEVDRFMNSTSKYVTNVDKLVDLLEGIEKRISTVQSIEQKAEEQIGKLDAIIEEKRRTYDIRRLEKNLENYNIGVQKVSEFINKDVAENLQESNERISQIQDKNSSILKTLVEEKSSIEQLVESYNSSNELLKKVVENKDVNEEYIFEILDRWAEDRKVRIKK